MTHWTKLKHDVEAAGGVWTNRTAAENFLAGRTLVDGGSDVFDASKPYFEVYGSPAGVMYRQGNTLFNKQGKKVG